MRHMKLISLAALMAALIVSISLQAQVTRREGRVLSISGETIVAQFENVQVSVGEEAEIMRHEKIVDPVSGKTRGETSITIGRGVVVDFGLNKANIRVTATENRTIEIDDIVILTGTEKIITRPEGPKFGEIQEITDETIVTNLGVTDEISPGDVFLIQRNEPVLDPETNEVIGTNSVNVGRYSVDSVGDTQSVARVIEQNLTPQKTDIVYKESEYLQYLAMLQSDSVKINRLESDVELLKSQVRRMRTELDSLKNAHYMHIDDYNMLKQDIESVLGGLQSGDLGRVRIRLANDEPMRPTLSSDLKVRYEAALSLCMRHKYQQAIDDFTAILSRYPDVWLSENCRYWIAQCKFALKDYMGAEPGFQSVIADKRFDHKDDDAAIMLGITYLRMNQADRARDQFKDFVTTYPDSEYRNKVNYWIAKLP